MHYYATETYVPTVPTHMHKRVRSRRKQSCRQQSTGRDLPQCRGN
jgi:hypothetical protein